ncbi:DMT family transporter [Candidatus Manganitrophus noduliformans]|uniref:DMT family transporter n=1 Tax=Candidatus Manganitrophus noduliformans TaxID=2606439 RepID=A0A7X6DRW4_9BACT|nr:DMT family transporter [Candidatus Manganitrophus noduliformans]NKE72252.1 DMT family transporter [Candidatus Manganitrophus noduliformans]
MNPIEARLVPYLVLINLLWGGNVVSIKLGAGEISPLTMATLRFLIGGSVILLYAAFRKIGLGLARKEVFLHLMNGLLFAVQIALFYLGTFRTSASHASVLINTHLFFVAVLAHFFILHDRLSVRKISGLALAFLGAVVLFRDRPERAMETVSLLGNSFVLISAFVLAVKIIYIKRLIERIDPVKVVFWEMAIGVPLLGLIAFFFGETLPDRASARLMGAMLYQGIVVGAFCFVASTVLLKRYAASSIASFSVLVPFFGVTLSHLFLGDPLTPHLTIGGGMIILGIGIVNIRWPMIPPE